MVWEESIILAPKDVRFAFLSATIPNSREFADWVAKTHGSPCDVVYTGGRPPAARPAGGEACRRAALAARRHGMVPWEGALMRGPAGRPCLVRALRDDGPQLQPAWRAS